MYPYGTYDFNRMLLDYTVWLQKKITIMGKNIGTGFPPEILVNDWIAERENAAN